MLLHGGVLAGDRIVSPSTVAVMTSGAMDTTVELYRVGYGFGHCGCVQPGVPGPVEKQIWNGAYGTGFFVDPRQKLVVFGTAAPGPLCQYDREPVLGPVYGAMTR